MSEFTLFIVMVLAVASLIPACAYFLVWTLQHDLKKRGVKRK